ncbi:DUF1593-domain-containing protein [Cadophora sp. DSE1049]|nr:DUF1593-domain-containing protein [Cadophora sp. DSE1049]
MPDQTRFRVCDAKPRVFVISDISNEPDDAESLVRYLLYGNELDTRGLVACTSTHMRKQTCAKDMVTIISAYSHVVDNLNAHVHPENRYPDAQYLLDMVKSGPPLYGKLALEPNVPLSEGAKLLVDRLDESEDPLWVLCWGGTNVLAQALQQIHATRSVTESAHIRCKIRVYAISDQDDTGLWIRLTFPDIFYICSVHGWNQYKCATWTGISGATDVGGSDPSKLTHQWLKENIQIGPLGQTYPDFQFLVEGDSPTFMYLIQNGLGSPEDPTWGSWGGRYDPVDISLAGKHYSDTSDTVIGRDGNTYTSNFATIWRWRDAFQNDFAARMQWTMVSDNSKANHAPVVIVNESNDSPKPLVLELEAGETVSLDASKSYDPDGDDLAFNWFQYKEVSFVTAFTSQQIPDIEIKNSDPHQPGRRVKITLPPPEICGIDPISGKAKAKGEVYHFILEVKDNGTPSLTTYKRVVIQTTNHQLRGERAFSVNTSADLLEL